MKNINTIDQASNLPNIRTSLFHIFCMLPNSCEPKKKEYTSIVYLKEAKGKIWTLVDT